MNVEEDQEVCDQCQTVETRSRQGETEEQTQVGDQVENELSNISTVMEVKSQEMMRIKMHVNLTIQGAREVLSRRSREHLSSTIVNAVVYSHG